jgi:hypothetical protein
MAERITKKAFYAELREIVFAFDTINEPFTIENVLAFIDHEVELIDRKHGADGKPTKGQVINEGIKNLIVAELAGYPDGLRASEIAGIVGYTVQKVTALLKQLVTDGKVARNEKGKVVTFTVA